MNAAWHDVCATGSDLTLIGGRFHALLSLHNIERFGSRMRVDACPHSWQKDCFGKMSDRLTDRQR
jgi:hypothetical protein